MWPRAAILAVALALIGCGAAPNRASSSKSDAVLLVKAQQPNASIWIDGRFVAEVGQARGGVAVEAGEHQVEVRHDGYHSFYTQVKVGVGERRTIIVELAEDLP